MSFQRKRVVYIAGPFRGKNHWEVEQNIRRAEALALEVWNLGGVAVICPHTNTRFFDGAAPDEVWLDGDLELMARCDAVLMTPDFERSTGAKRERNEAFDLFIPVFYTVAEVKEWLSAAPSYHTIVARPLPHEYKSNPKNA
jgi:hypothetical protein